MYYFHRSFIAHLSYHYRHPMRGLTPPACILSALRASQGSVLILLGGYESIIINYQLSIINYQLSIINYQFSIFN